MDFRHNFSLKRFNTFGVPVSARRFFSLSSTEDIQQYLRKHHHLGETTLVLGGGSNILFTKNFDGTVLKIDIPGIHVVKENAEFFWVKVGSGVVWNDLVESCIRASMGGVENLSLIPGTVGAAPVQNIGAYGVEIRDVLEAVEAIEIGNGARHYFRNEECRFAYRDSIFKNEWKDKFIITNVALRLRKSPLINTSYGQIAELLREKGVKNPGIREVSDAVIEIRKSKLPDPAEAGNAGSFFKNPVIPAVLYEKIKASYTTLHGYIQEDGSVKIPAAWLIDQCGLKGHANGGAAVHDKQPLVIVNRGNATGTEILELANEVQASVLAKFQVQLEPEVRII